MKLQIIDIIEETTVDGPGFRTSVYCAGCQHACPGCHNPQSWPADAGSTMDVEELAEKLLDDPFTNITYSGGDPMYQAEGFTELSRLIRERSRKNIWCYSGFTFETLMRNPAQRALLEQIDVLVDGPFVQSLKNEDLLFRGSSNQRIIDVPASLKNEQVVLWDGGMVVNPI